MIEQQTLFDGPATTRRLAADAIAKRAGKLQSLVLHFIDSQGKNGATDHEVAESLGLQLDTSRARRCELRDGGQVVDSGRQRPTASGRGAVVWVAARFATSGTDHFGQNNEADPPARSTRRTAGSIGGTCDHPDIEEVETFDHFLNRRCRVCGKQLRCRPADRPDASSPNKPR
ncbi:MAG: hypothetical protein GX621_13465 [Pirellulaceae bacterium]|nr:hypothetical protein [Pirellulaceae bacterium]